MVYVVLSGTFLNDLRILEETNDIVIYLLIEPFDIKYILVNINQSM